MDPEASTTPATLATAFKLQAGLCRHLESPLYAAMMAEAEADVLRGGAVAASVAGWRGDPLRGFLPLRLFGAVHALALSGEASSLARHYPTTGGDGDAAAAWPAFLATLEAHRGVIAEWLEAFPQTNEVRRCAGLLGGFLEVAAQTGLPLHLRELGCSAGLNLQWARYAYRLGPHRWGAADSRVQIGADWQGPPPALDAPVDTPDRAGCDIDPRSIATDTDARRLEAYVWPDQPDRLAQLRGAIAIAREDPPRVERARAMEWLEAELAARADGACTVVYHSSFWIYLSDAEKARIHALMGAEGARATRDRPLAWLRHEDDQSKGTVEIRLTQWPGGHERKLGLGHPHGRRVVWGNAPG